MDNQVQDSPINVDHRFVADNNEISSLMIRIEEEKKRICKELSMQVKKNALSLTSALETLTVIDVAFTKAKWAVRYDGMHSIFTIKRSLYVFRTCQTSFD